MELILVPAESLQMKTKHVPYRMSSTESLSVVIVVKANYFLRRATSCLWKPWTESWSNL